MLTVTKVTDFWWTRSQRVWSNSVTSLRLQKPSPTLIGIALQANRAESLPEDLTPNPKKPDWGLRILLFQAFDFLRPERPASNLGNRAYFRPGMGWIGSFSSTPTSSVKLTSCSSPLDLSLLRHCDGQSILDERKLRAHVLAIDVGHVNPSKARYNYRDLNYGTTPDHPSFHDNNMPPPPAKWKGKCEFTGSITCNNKLISARNLLGGGSSDPPFDDSGHGTHTSSTISGNFVDRANIFGNANGTSAGMAPLAHVAMCKVCSKGGSCEKADTLCRLRLKLSFMMV
ncbi:hypothetical protein T459_32046 [Capsicum annuum]|uniref:Peptidase S8/S53 domain-containing protein n=1 Tax=Capsicum annuum TaxID=4072 RepID=A0A2G2Y324_CAPAN|nr:hypothetical protein T459_32046 [Capsicum annuum]